MDSFKETLRQKLGPTCTREAILLGICCSAIMAAHKLRLYRRGVMKASVYAIGAYFISFGLGKYMCEYTLQSRKEEATRRYGKFVNPPTHRSGIVDEDDE